MDQLELLKKQWQSREQELPKLTYNDIYSMLLKKSSSIVKWIFLYQYCRNNILDISCATRARI
jgi:hypothetical protein